MMIREEFLELLRTDQTFREEVRRQVLTEELLALPGKFDQLSERLDRLTELVHETVEAVRELTEAQRRTEETLHRHEEILYQNSELIQELIKTQGRMQLAVVSTQEALQQLINWQRGEAGRRKGEQVEREIIRAAPVLFNGGQGGAPDQPWVQQRLTELMGSLLAEDIPPQSNPFLADLIWWKGERLAVVEISHQVNGYDVLRAARRAEILRRTGVQVWAFVIGEDWSGKEDEARREAKIHHVGWKVGSDLSEDFLTFRRLPPR